MAEISAKPSTAPRAINRYRARNLLGSVFINGILIVISIICILPVIVVVSSSLTTEAAFAKYGYTILPVELSLGAYQYIFADPAQLFMAYGVSLLVTVLGTSGGLLVMSLLAYMLSRKDFRLRKLLSFYVFFTMLFSGGLVSSYILVTQILGMKNTLQVLILPSMVAPWLVLLLRTYFATIPDELLDAARIDGAGEWRTFFQIVIPLSTPALATVALFAMLAYWNDWFTALIYIDDRRLVPVQYLLYTIQTNIDFLLSSPQAASILASSNIQTPVQAVRMALVVLAIGPIAFAYLGLQRYFIRGITIGALK